ncbi:MAG TPA: 30S ribosomal protein S9 [Patescibacteria group bacterium]|nr:30S ribosomal protein S9 [Patescibacteria group bacterium]
MATATKKKETNRTIGRRKTAVARVQLTGGKGEITINGKGLKQFFGNEYWWNKVVTPLRLVGQEKAFDISVRVVGGGINAQAEAIRHGIARALISLNPEFRPVLKAEGLLKRDPRAKERKKFGLHRARRAHQWRKR